MFEIMLSRGYMFCGGSGPWTQASASACTLQGQASNCRISSSREDPSEHANPIYEGFKKLGPHFGSLEKDHNVTIWFSYGASFMETRVSVGTITLKAPDRPQYQNLPTPLGC